MYIEESYLVYHHQPCSHHMGSSDSVQERQSVSRGCLRRQHRARGIGQPLARRGFLSDQRRLRFSGARDRPDCEYRKGIHRVGKFQDRHHSPGPRRDALFQLVGFLEDEETRH